MTATRIALTPQELNEGSDYERAAFGLIEIKVGGNSLTDVVRSDSPQFEYCSGPYVSGYHLAEWLVWNWWRLRWEPMPTGRRSVPIDWALSHRMSDIGEGYRWPNVTISCDGLRCVITSEPSNELDTPRFRYLGGPPASIPVTEWESTVDEFTGIVIERLDQAGIVKTNLHLLWEDLQAERRDLEIAKFRKLEGLMGFNPDEADTDRVDKLLMDAHIVGEDALAEIATGSAYGTLETLSAQQINNLTKAYGFEVKLQDAFTASYPLTNSWGHVPAWRIGVSAALNVRQQAGLGDDPIDNAKLAALAGMSSKGLACDSYTGSVSWMFDPDHSTPRIAFRTWRANGRRFDLARLIGDRLFVESGSLALEPLAPATRAYSYRQKAQRAFAAELLSPWDVVKSMLGNDYSDDNIESVAEHFSVSPLTIDTLVLNNQNYIRDPDGEPVSV